MDNKNTYLDGQTSIYDLLDMLNHQIETATSKEIKSAIDKLYKMKVEAEKREREERQRQEELRRQQQRAEELKRHKEHIENVTSMDLPLDWNNVFDDDPRASGIHAESISDGLIYSLNTLGRVDIEYIASITGESYKTVINTLKGSIFQNPNTWEECFYKGWETAEEYLSGNLHCKLRAAINSNKEYNGYFSDNIEAIQKVLPPAVSSEDIYVTLGSPWVPTWIIDQFIGYMIGGRYYNDYSGMTKHDELTGTWEINNKGFYNYGVESTFTYGTTKIQALHILEKTLNMKTVAVYDTVSDPKSSSGKKRVLNNKETMLAAEKQQKMIKEFQSWVWKDGRRKETLERIFEERYSSVRKRIFNGSFLNFPTMSKDVQLYDYQKDAIARIIFTPNTLLAHDVGAGKTHIMIAAGMELRRMGLSKKNMYVVPNNIVGQWKNIFSNMYPKAKILCVEPKSFRPSKRLEVLEKIRDEDFDGIIIAYSCFEQIPLSKSFYKKELEEEKNKLENVLNDNKKITSRSKNKMKAVKKALGELTVAIDDLYNLAYFDTLGITRLFVDEAHNFKNVPIDTKIDKVMGINKTGSKRCQDMLDKVHMVQKKNEGGGVVLATGTPITNSITDAFIMQKYLQDGELGLLELQHFDSWIGMFAEKKTEFEIDVDTNSYRLATRFSKFHNLPELTALLSSVADFHSVDKTTNIPEHDGYQDALISKSQDLQDYLDVISDRADAVRHGLVTRDVDNMLKITTDGRKAALDMRLIDSAIYKYSYQTKVARCVDNVVDIYFKTWQDKSTQLIFCDYSTPKSGFNIYDDIKEKLIQRNVDEETIAFVHDANTEKKREKLFKDIREGNIRILIGSTFKLGLGVNVQDKLIALHHIDVPWRPADMVQREGRILRQGNTNAKVQIFRYITEGSFDAYSWQLLETKQRFITDLLSGSITERSGSDIEDTVLDYAEVKALAVGNPLVKERVEAFNELNRYKLLQHKLIDNRINLEKELMELPGRIEHQNNIIVDCKKDLDFYINWKKLNPEPENNKEKKEVSQSRKLLRETIHQAILHNVLESKERTFITYRGFEIILPANMKAEKPYVWLKRQGKYYVELGDTEVGNLIRIDNYLDNLEKHLEGLQENFVKLRKKQEDIKKELSTKEDYTDKIQMYKEKVKTLDKKLGVDKDE